MGHLPSTKPQPRGSRSSRLNGAAALLVTFVVIGLLAVSPALSQSGRKKEPGKPKPQGPMVDPTRPSGSTTTNPNTGSTRSRTVGDEVDQDDVVRISSNLVPIPVSVVDVRGQAVVNLKVEDFELRVDGQVRPLSELIRTDTSVRLAMLFDNSGSLDFAREFEKLAAMHFFRKVMRPRDEAAIYSIENDFRLAQPLTSDIARLEQTIALFGKPEGGTPLFDTIIHAAGYLRPYTGRRVIVIVSDGIETTSQHTEFEPVVKSVLAGDSQIYVVQTGLYEGANLRALAAERRMEQLASQTGGAVYLPKTTTELDFAFSQIAADLSQQYVLSYYPAPEQRDGRLHTLELRLKDRNDVRIRSRKGYYAPKSAQAADW